MVSLLCPSHMYNKTAGTSLLCPSLMYNKMVEGLMLKDGSALQSYRHSESN